MAVITGTKVDFPEIASLRAELRKFPSNIAAKHLGAALRKASKPGVAALKAEVRQNQKGPTGNLLRSVATLVKTYKRDGNAVAVVGFTKASKSASSSAGGGTVRKGKDLAFHAPFLEFGTKQRTTKKGSIASSYRRLGPFELKPPAKRGKFAGVVRVNTSPKYPKAFFKRAPAGQKVNLGQTLAEEPLRTSFKKATGQIRSALRDGVSTAIENAGKDLADKFPPKGRTT
jgi:hypothetical protein